MKATKSIDTVHINLGVRWKILYLSQHRILRIVDIWQKVKWTTYVNIIRTKLIPRLNNTLFLANLRKHMLKIHAYQFHTEFLGINLEWY